MFVFKTVKIRSYEVGLYFRDGEFKRLLGEGRHWFFDPLGKVRIDVVSVHAGGRRVTANRGRPTLLSDGMGQIKALLKRSFQKRADSAFWPERVKLHTGRVGDLPRHPFDSLQQSIAGAK